MPDRFQLLFLVAVAAAGAGCAMQPRTVESPRPADSSTTPAQPSVQRPPPVNLSGYSAAFKQGYTDGCASVRGTTRRDDARYRSDSDYMMGWSDGNSACRAKR
ncbi:MAG: hypothetical protein ACT4PS_13165 [Betaproteobacteria bacterium]